MAARCDEIRFSLYGEEGYGLVDGVANFKYLGRPLDQTDYAWSEVLKKIMRAMSV